MPASGSSTVPNAVLFYAPSPAIAAFFVHMAACPARLFRPVKDAVIDIWPQNQRQSRISVSDSRNRRHETGESGRLKLAM